MNSTLHKAVVFACILAMALPSAAAHAETASTVTTRTCGAFRYDATRITDGYFVKVTDGTRVRTILYKDILAAWTWSTKSSLIAGCDGSSIAFVDVDRSKYSSSDTVREIDPTQTFLRIQSVGAKVAYSYGSPQDGSKFFPESETSRVTELLSRTRDERTVERAVLLSKAKIANEPNTILNDRSYFVFDGKGEVTKNTAPSSWNTTQGTTAVACDGATYVLYKKTFSDVAGPTATFPKFQFIVERSGRGPTKLIPVPSVDRAWQDQTKYFSNYQDPSGYVSFGSCVNGNVTIDVYTGSSNRTTMITDSTSFVDYMSPVRSLEAPFVDAAGYYQRGRISFTGTDVTGTATLFEMRSDGTVVARKPVYFKDIRQYPIGTVMEFRKDSQESGTIVVVVYSPYANTAQPQTYFAEHNGIYTQIDRNESDWSWARDRIETATPLYLSADKDMVTLRSFYLPKPMLLHYLPGTTYTLNRYRIGPLELDGSRKVWYELTINGKTETWLARVR